MLVEMKKSIEIMDGEPHPMVTRTDTPMVTITLPDNDSVTRFDYTVQEVDVKGLLEFARWVADEIFEAEDAPDNPFDCGYGGAFAEIACRKLHKLGIVEMKGENWHYEPTKTAQD